MTKNKKKESAFDKLSDRHKILVLNYIKNLCNKTRAYMDTYPKAKYDTARTKSCELFAKDNIKAAIDEKMAEQFAEIQTETEKNKTYQLIKAIGDATVDEVIDLAGKTLTVKSLDEISPEARHAIASVQYDKKESDNSMSENIKVTFHNKLNALKLRAEIQKMIDPKNDTSKLEITVTPAERPTENKE